MARDTQPWPVFCENCRKPIMCDACRLSEAKVFGIGVITDELVMEKHNICERCESAWALPEEKRLPRDAEALRLIEMTNRNLKAYKPPRHGLERDY